MVSASGAGEKNEIYTSPGNERQSADQRSNGQRHGRIAPANRESQEGKKDFIAKTLEAAVESNFDGKQHPHERSH